MTMTAKTILYITRYYPPATGAAEIRAGHFIEALLNNNFNVIVLTAGPSPKLQTQSQNLTICHISENGQIPKEIDRTGLTHWPRWKPLPGINPAEKISKAMFLACQWLMKKHNIDTIFATGLPFGLIAVAHELAQRCNLPLIIELRDAWYTGAPWPYASYLEKRRTRMWEHRCLSHAQAIVTETATQKQILDNHYGPDIADKTFTIRHSFDERLTAAKSPENKTTALLKEYHQNDKFVIAYTGQLHGIDISRQTSLRKFTSQTGRLLRRVTLGATFCDKLRFDWMSPHYLMEALAKLFAEYPHWQQKVRLLLAGTEYSQIDTWACQMGLSQNIKQLGPVPSQQAQQIACHADLLVLTLYGITNMHYHWCVPGKTYSYLGAGKPILALLPNGEARDIIKQSGLGFTAPPDNITEIAQRLKKLITEHYNGGIKINPDKKFIRQFALPVQQKQFVEVVNKVIQERK
jgi:glycosyltransferase involved in cell wall biosynthesis